MWPEERVDAVDSDALLYKGGLGEGRLKPFSSQKGKKCCSSKQSI